MCLAVPGRVIQLDGDRAIVDLHGSRLKVSTLLTPHVAEGDWVLVHAGFALQQMGEGEAVTYSVLDDTPIEDIANAQGETHE